jgi:hypothetical protein
MTREQLRTVRHPHPHTERQRGRSGREFSGKGVD